MDDTPAADKSVAADISRLKLLPTGNESGLTSAATVPGEVLAFHVVP